MYRFLLRVGLPLVCVTACSHRMDSPALGLQYEPPSGMAVRSEEPGVVHFEGGLELRSIQGTPPRLEASSQEVLAAAGLPVTGRQLNATQGTLPAGTVARYELQQGASRTLVYFLPRPDRFVLVLYTAPEHEYGPGSARVERSLSTLTLTR